MSKNDYSAIGSEARGLCIATMGVTPEGVVFPVRCKKWRCPVCAPINALRWAIRLAHGTNGLIASGIIPRFLTITQPGSVRTREFAYRILHNQWGKFQNRWRRWTDEQRVEKWAVIETDEYVALDVQSSCIPLSYAAFVEGQPERHLMPHFHIIAAHTPHVETVREWAVKSGLGYEVDSEYLRKGPAVAWYASKYPIKSTAIGDMPEHFHRVRLSEDWPPLVFRSDVRESSAVVKLPRESYRVWADRAAWVLGIDMRSILDSALVLSEQNFDQEKDDLVVAGLSVDINNTLAV